MKILQQIAQQDPRWSLEELVQVANDLLPQFLPDEKVQTRVREDVTPRLVRHYTSQGMLDEPLKEGREARYTYRHLLQLLLVRRLLVEGYGANVIDTLARSKPNSDLEALLQGGVQLTVAPANPALAFLQTIQQRQPEIVARSQALGSVATPPSPVPATNEWTRIEIMPGVELHVRRDVVLPNAPPAQQNLAQQILHALIALANPKKRSKL